MKWLFFVVVVSGLLSAVTLAWPELVIAGYFLFILPGLILSFSPAVFLYSALLFMGLLATRGMSRIKRSVLLLVALGGVAFGIPAAVNEPERREQVRLTKGDSLELSPAPNAKSIVIVQNAAATCSDLCLRFLYNGGFETVIMASAPAAQPDAAIPIVEAMGYRVEHRPACPALDYVNMRNWPTDPPSQGGALSAVARIRSRMAAGECVVPQPGRVADAELKLLLLFTPQPTGRLQQPQKLRAETIQAHRLELRRTDDLSGARPLYRKTLVTREPLSAPLVFGVVAGGGFSARVGFAYRRSFGTSFENEPDDFVRLFRERVRLPDAGSAEDIRKRLETALDRQDDQGAVQEFADALLGHIEGTRQVGPRDVALIGRAISDPRMTKFIAFTPSAWVFGDRLDPIAPQIMQRMLDPPMTNAGDPGDRVSAMAYAVSVLSAEGIKSIAPDLLRLLDIPFTRGRGALAITRLSDIGPEGVQRLTDLQQASALGDGTSSGSAEDMASLRWAARKGLCLARSRSRTGAADGSNSICE